MEIRARPKGLFILQKIIDFSLGKESEEMKKDGSTKYN